MAVSQQPLYNCSTYTLDSSSFTADVPADQTNKIYLDLNHIAPYDNVRNGVDNPIFVSRHSITV